MENTPSTAIQARAPGSALAGPSLLARLAFDAAGVEDAAGSLASTRQIWMYSVLNAWIYFNRALIHIHIGESTRAVPDLERSLELGDPSLDPERRTGTEKLLDQLQNWSSEA